MLCYSQGLIDDAEFLILSSGPVQKSSGPHLLVLYKPRNLDLPYSSYPLFDQEDVDDDECLAENRFKKRDIPVKASLTKYQVRIYLTPVKASLTKYQVRIYMDNHMAWTSTILFSRAEISKRK